MKEYKESRSNCIFCKILDGKAPVSMIYEDEKVAVFVDLRPILPGHLLIIPKEHAPYMKDVPPETLAHIMVIAQKMNAALRASGMKCEAVNLHAADGEEGGQEIFHFHLHVYPRYRGDGFGFRYEKGVHFQVDKRQRMDKIAANIRKHLEI